MSSYFPGCVSRPPYNPFSLPDRYPPGHAAQCHMRNTLDLSTLEGARAALQGALDTLRALSEIAYPSTRAWTPKDSIDAIEIGLLDVEGTRKMILDDPLLGDG